MKTITLQTKGISLAVKKKADKVAKKKGYNSVQDVVRMFVNDFANEKTDIKRTWGAGLDPEVQEALAEYRRGETHLLDLNLPVEEAMDKLLNELPD